MTAAELIDYLLRCRLIPDREVEVVALAGGVSANVSLVTTSNRRFVVKEALEKLKVHDDWRCDPNRNSTECSALKYVASFIPDAVPRVQFADPEQHLFVMEYLGDGFSTWKNQLLQGRVFEPIAERAARTLAALHNATWQSEEASRLFDTTRDFYALRIEPYLIATGKRHPDLQDLFETEAMRIREVRIAVVHGDYSAKNLLVSSDRLVVLDWEVAWFGDPAFDSAFLLNLLYLKSLYRGAQLDDFLRLIHVFRTTYAHALLHHDDALDRRIGRLTLMLMLARIDGKSPVEYLTSDQHRCLVRDFVAIMLRDGIDEFGEIDACWKHRVAKL